MPIRLEHLMAACALGFMGSAVSADLPSIYPPWQQGRNNDALDRGLQFTIPEVDNLADFHGDLTDPTLVLYVGGNYFFAMAPLVQSFEEEHPQYRGRLLWETIPPGRLVEQMKGNGRITVGNMTFTARADVYFAGLNAVKRLIAEGRLKAPAVPYVTNDLTIMIPANNPKHIRTLKDLGQPGVRLAMPNPQFEGIARQIKVALGKAGGEALVRSVYEWKVASGESTLTEIHHRQTPLWLMQGKVDAGVTWRSEAIFQEEIKNPLSHIDLPASQNATGIYAGAQLSDAPHVEAAALWLAFISSPRALAIFEHYGFKRYLPTGDAADE